MNSLTINKKENITSLELLKLINNFREEESNRVELKHNTLLKYIREELGLKFILQSSYINEQNKIQPMYILTLKQALRLLSKESRFVRGKVFEYIDKLEKEIENLKIALANRNNTEWLMTRQQGNLTRRNETDIIAELILYAKEQGSQNADKMYMTYSKLTNKLVGISSGMRDIVDKETLLHIRKLEDLFSKVIYERMKDKMYYKDIYKECKRLGEEMMKYLTLDIRLLK